MIGTITKNNFFNTKATYVTENENQNNTAISSSLTVTIDTDIHTAVWTNNSQEVSAELVEITNEIKNKAHEKNDLKFII